MNTKKQSKENTTSLYKDITNKWLKSQNKKSTIVKYKKGDTFKYKGIKYIIDNYNIVIDYKEGEIDFIRWLTRKTNKKIKILQRFNKPDGFKTPDYKIGNEYYDYKQTTGKSNQLIYHNLEKAKGQSINFILNITNKSLSKKEIERQVNEAFRRLKWVEKIGIKSKYGFNIYARKTSSRGEKVT